MWGDGNGYISQPPPKKMDRGAALAKGRIEGHPRRAETAAQIVGHFACSAIFLSSTKKKRLNSGQPREV